MKTYSATFSNGQTKTRNSKHSYRYAVGLVHKTTGKLENVKFTAGDPTPDWRGVASTVRSGGPISQRDADRYNRQAMAEHQNWKVEVITL